MPVVNGKIKTKHPQVWTKLPSLQQIQVDEKMNRLLNLMWKLGIETTYSCQGDDFFKDPTHYENMRHRAYIQMPRTHAAVDFVGQLILESGLLHEENILWSIEFNRNPFDDKDDRISLRFPQQDIAELETYVQSRIDGLRLGLRTV